MDNWFLHLRVFEVHESHIFKNIVRNLKIILKTWDIEN